MALAFDLNGSSVDARSLRAQRLRDERSQLVNTARFNGVAGNDQGNDRAGLRLAVSSRPMSVSGDHP